MHIFTWRKRKKVFHPNGELNWNILLPSSSGMPERKSISSPQLSILDIHLHARPESTNPYFLPTKQLRPSFSHLISNAPVEEPKPVESAACVLSTFQTETVSGNPGAVLAKRVRSDWSVCYGSGITPATMDKTPYERCSSAASSLREPDARRKKFNPSKRLSCPVITPIYSDESPATIPYLPITLSRSPGEKLGLGLSIQTQPTTDTVDHVLIRTAPPDSSIQPGDEILVVNGVDLRTLSRSACVELFSNAPLRLSLLVRRPGVPEVGRNVISASPTHWSHSGCSAMDRRKVRRPGEPPPPPPLLEGERGGGEYERVEEEQYENIYDLPYSDKHNPSEREYHVITEFDAPRYESSYSSSCDNQPIKKHKQSDFNSNFTFRAPTCALKVTPPDDHSHDSALNTSSGSSGSSDFTVDGRGQPPKITEGFNPLSRSDSVSQCSYDPEYDDESVYCDTVVLQRSLDTPERRVSVQQGLVGDRKEGGSSTDGVRHRNDTTALTPESLLSQKHKLRHIQSTMNAPPPIPLKDFILACDDLPETSVDELDVDAGTKKVTFAPGSPVTVLGQGTTSPTKSIDGAMYRAYVGLKGRRKEKRNIPNDVSSAAHIRSILKTGQVGPVKMEMAEQVDNVDWPESGESGQDGVSGQTGNALYTTNAERTLAPEYAVALVDHPAVDALPAHQCTADVTVHADDQRDGTVDVSLLSDVHLESVAPKSTLFNARTHYLTKSKRPDHYTGKLDLSQLSPVPGEIYAGHCADSSVDGASTHVTRHFITQSDNPLKTGCGEQETARQQCNTSFFTKSWWKVSDKVFGSVEQEEDSVALPVDLYGDIVLDTAENWHSAPHPPPPQSPVQGHIPAACSDLSSRSLRPHTGPKPIPPPKPKFLSRRLTPNKTNPVKTNINTDKIHTPAASAMWQQCNNTGHLNGPLIDNNTHSVSSSSDDFDVVPPCSTDDLYHTNHPPHFPHDALDQTELVATKNHLHRATFIECVDTEPTDSMTELIDFSDHRTALPPPPDFAGGDLTLLDFSSDFLPNSMEFLPQFPSNPTQSDSPFYLEAMRDSTDSGNYPDLGTVVSESTSYNTCSLSVSTTSDTSDTEDSFSVSLRRDSSSSETDGHPYDIEVLHMNWDIGLKVTADRKGRWMVRDISRTSPLLRLGNVKPGDYVLKINGQSLRGMGEGEVGTLIRALPRGLVQMTVVGGGEKDMEKRDSLVTLESASSGDPDTIYSLTDPPAPADMASRHSYSYSREVNYGMTRNVQPQVQSSTVIQPIARTEITRAKSIHMNEPTEFIVKIQKDPSMEAPSRGLAALRQHSNSFHYDPPSEPVFELEEERSVRKMEFDDRAKKTNGNGDLQKGQFVDTYKFDTDDRTRKFNGTAHSPAPQKTHVDPYKISRDSISDDFKKKREKFLGQSMDADQNKGTGKVNGTNDAQSVADRRSRFAGNDTQSMPQAPPVVPPKASFDRQPSVHKVETPSTNGSRSIPPVINRPSVLQQPKNEPPLTQNRAWNRDRHRSSSISSVESLSNSVTSFSSSDPSRHEISERRSSIRDEPVSERKPSIPKPLESLDRGRISPAQLSRQLAKSSVSASHTSLHSAGTTGGKFAEAMARYKAKTDDGVESGGSGRRGSKPLVIPVAKTSVMSRATLFEQKSVEAASVPVPLSVGAKTRSVSQSSLPGSGGGFREWNGGRNGGGKGGALQTQVEEEVEMGNWRKPSKSDMVTPEPTANEIPYTPRPRSIQPEPVNEVYMPRRSHMEPQPRDSPTVVRTVRDSGVSSSSSSVGDSPPPPASPEHKLINTSNRLSVNYADLPIPTEEFLQSPPMPESPAPMPLALGAVAAQVAAVQTGPGRQAETARKVRSVSREREPKERRGRDGEAKDGSVIEGEESGQEQMVEMGKRLLGPEAQDCDVVVVTLSRPDGTSGGGVGVVLTGGADSENNHIKINKVITHSLAHRDGRIQAGDRLLLINAQPCTNMTHRQALDVLKAPAPHVSLVLARYH